MDPLSLIGYYRSKQNFRSA